MVDTPLFPDVGVLGLVPNRWGNIWQPRHHILRRLSRYFHVVWMNPAHEWRDALKGRDARETQAALPGYPPSFSVYTPEPWLPLLYRPRGLADFTAQRRLRSARQLLLDRGCRTIILYIWRPEFAPALQFGRFDLSCYHIDDEYSFSEVDAPVDDNEAALIARVDQVIIHSRGLLEKKGAINPATALIPNGVDYDAYSRVAAEPEDLASIPNPRIGYTGIIKRQLDWPLLLQLTLQRPDWSFVFVGPHLADPDTAPAIQQLSSRKNVHFLGSKSVRELAAYPQHFDVCIMPYKADDYTKYIYPLKLHEYLASGRPVVGTRILSLEEFGDLIGLPRSLSEWTSALTDALTPAAATPERRRVRQEVARRHDWNTLVARIAGTMCRRLGHEFAARFERLDGRREQRTALPLPSCTSAAPCRPAHAIP